MVIWKGVKEIREKIFPLFINDSSNSQESSFLEYIHANKRDPGKSGFGPLIIC